jgi:hypothetical protein
MTATTVQPYNSLDLTHPYCDSASGTSDLFQASSPHFRPVANHITTLADSSTSDKNNLDGGETIGGGYVSAFRPMKHQSEANKKIITKFKLQNVAMKDSRDI